MFYPRVSPDDPDDPDDPVGPVGPVGPGGLVDPAPPGIDCWPRMDALGSDPLPRCRRPLPNLPPFLVRTLGQK